VVAALCRAENCSGVALGEWSTTMSTDLEFTDHGSIWLLRAASPRGGEWLDEHVEAGGETWCGAIVVEPRYVFDIVDGAEMDGLRVTT